MAKNIPFDEDIMTLIMGVGGPEEPGQHGRTNAPMPTQDAIGILTQIRDLCDEFLVKAGKEEEGDKPEKKKESEEDFEEAEE